MREPPQKGFSRRRLLKASTAAIAGSAVTAAQAVTINGPLEWVPFSHNGPLYYDTPGWQFFTAQEALVVEAIVDRLIPADDLSVGGKEAGCAVFIDRQMATPYGFSERRYQQGPFLKGTPEQGDQSPLTPRQRYRQGLSALRGYCLSHFGQSFETLPSDRQDEVLKGLENGTVALNGFDAKMFFAAILNNTMEGFFADPIYGGNRDMVSWKMLGFPGARYDYRNQVTRYGEKLNLIPLAITGSAAWQIKS